MEWHVLQELPTRTKQTERHTSFIIPSKLLTHQMIRHAGHLPLTKQVPPGGREQRPVPRQDGRVEAADGEARVVAVVPLPEQEAAAAGAEAALAVRRGRVQPERRPGREGDGGLGHLVGAEDEGARVFAALLALAGC